MFTIFAYFGTTESIMKYMTGANEQTQKWVYSNVFKVNLKHSHV